MTYARIVKTTGDFDFSISPKAEKYQVPFGLPRAFSSTVFLIIQLFVFIIIIIIVIKYVVIVHRGV